MHIRRLVCGLLLIAAGSVLHGCRDPEKDGCKRNLVVPGCIPVEPEGNVTATPSTAQEGKSVRFKLDFFHPNEKDTITCKLDPEGDGSYQLDVSCKGEQDYIYQETGTYLAAVQVTDTKNVQITRTVSVTITEGDDGNPITQFKLVDAAREIVTGAQICVIPADASDCTSGFTFTESAPGTYTVTPGLPQDAPDANNYKLKITQGTPPVSVTLDVRVDNDNVPQSVTFITPYDCSDRDACINAQGTDASNGGTIATLSGVVLSSSGAPIANAQVSITGGSTTGGPYSTVFTNAQGQFDLLINVGEQLTEAITNSNLLIFAPGFNTVVSQFSVTPRHFFGLNFSVEPLATPPVRHFLETFESDSATAGQWVAAGGVADTKWQKITSSSSIVNKLSPNCVSPAPADASGGALLPPVDGNTAYWYGGISTGSFIGELSGTTADCGHNGGSSKASHSGTLTSPVIDLTGVSNPVRLTMKTFWEIESVNPNGGGFDLMKVYVSTDGGETFEQVGALNPLSDPVGGGERASKPYTSVGFNAPPLWVQQESIALPDNLGGNANVKLRFEFTTVDSLYNGFRGWMIDEIVIEPGQGSL